MVRAGRRARSGRQELRRHGANRRRPAPQTPGGASRTARAQSYPVSRAAALVFISFSLCVIVAAHCPPLTCRDRCLPGQKDFHQAAGADPGGQRGQLPRPRSPLAANLASGAGSPAAALCARSGLSCLLACAWHGAMAFVCFKPVRYVPCGPCTVRAEPVRCGFQDQIHYSNSSL